MSEYSTHLVLTLRDGPKLLEKLFFPVNSNATFCTLTIPFGAEFSRKVLCVYIIILLCIYVLKFYLPIDYAMVYQFIFRHKESKLRC